MTHLPWLASAFLTAAVSAQSHDAVSTLLGNAIERAHGEIARSIDIWSDHSDPANPWIVRSEHYEVRIGTTWADGNRIAQGLEGMFGHFRNVLASDFAPSQRFRIDVVDLQTYQTRGNAVQDNGAAHHSSMYGSFLDRDQNPPPVVVVADANDTSLQMSITHSAAHQFVAAAFTGTIPTWLDEGLAAYFASYWASDWYLDEFKRIRSTASYVPLDRLLTTSIDNYSKPEHVRLIELATLFTYLMHWREDTRTDEAAGTSVFRDYIVGLLRGQRPASLPGNEITADLPALDAELRNFDFAQ